MEIKGVFISKSDIREFESGFKVQEFYVDCKRFNQFTGESYENILKFQSSRSGILDALALAKKGDEVNVTFNPQGRVYDKKDGTGKGHIQNLEVWKIEILNAVPETKTNQQTTFSEETDDDLPF
ncbi:hypothetical protein CMT89_08410 [Elizabethkingia anophelis]|nr:hypothetical protein [Elizabethkingia anophelis]MDV4058411.1 hypothetical protein [Elizabethkingia anophelis]